jgi:hypothetical protein
MKKSPAAEMIANLLVGELPSLKNSMPHNQLESAAEKFIDEWRTFALMNAVKAPGDKPPGEKTYPSRTELQPEYEPVPDPAKTETSEPSKPSLPDYMGHVATLDATGRTLFDDPTADTDMKVQSIKYAIAAMDGITSILKKF